MLLGSRGLWEHQRESVHSVGVEHPGDAQFLGLVEERERERQRERARSWGLQASSMSDVACATRCDMWKTMENVMQEAFGDAAFY